MDYAVGSLVRARGREWMVLPESEADLLVLRPLGGTDDEVTGIYLPLEQVERAEFAPPDPARPGDYRTARLLRDAVRLGIRASAGPFRSFARIAVEPRPYQLVPLMMALRLDPVRLLIADDVGIGKTVEACLVARELLDRGEVDRLAVLCPPHLAEQWQAELRDKFHIDAELVLPGTVARLERGTRLGQSLFELHPFVIISTDFIKSDRRRDEFRRACPELVIVDEAHTCAWGGEGRGGRHQRHQLVSALAADTRRHLILVTATPHSGNEAAFRSLLRLLDPAFGDLPEDLTGTANEVQRRHLAEHFVQRRRGDIRHYLQTDTPFPARDRDIEQSYKLSEPYRRLFAKVLRYARETIVDESLGTHRQRVRWWSALALLRSLASSPAAAAATLRARAATADTETVEEADAIGRRTVLDLLDAESSEGADLTPGADAGDEASGANRRRLLEMAREADALLGQGDTKLTMVVKVIEDLLRDGYQPLIFCRFIPTAEYVAAALRKRLPGDVDVASVTGTLAPAEREARVHSLGHAIRRVLVATDCLSEGINLQQYFDAVVHYDLAWNPTRHEQREGRVDRYGQPSPTIRVTTCYGVDNQIDGIVLDVLIRKHKRIRDSLGISVPVPVDAEQVVEAVFEGLLLREQSAGSGVQQALPGFDELLQPREQAVLREWDATAAREKRSRTIFNQSGLHVDEVAAELDAVRAAIGSGVDVAAFTRDALTVQGAIVRTTGGALDVDLQAAPAGLRDALDAARWSGQPNRFTARFQLPVGAGELLLTRTHPIVEGLATYLTDTALDPLAEPPAPRRCGAIRTSAVRVLTTALLLRLRFHLVEGRDGVERPLLAEELQVVAFEDYPDEARWLDASAAAALLELPPEANVPAATASEFLREIVDGLPALAPALDRIARARAEDVLAAHRRVRSAARLRGSRTRVEAQAPPDLVAMYVYLPRQPRA